MDPSARMSLPHSGPASQEPTHSSKPSGSEHSGSKQSGSKPQQSGQTSSEQKHPGSIARIDLGRIQQNLDHLIHRSGTDRVMAVVKANAYGHGSIEVASFLEESVEQFAVATVDEGIELRQAGIQKPILVFGMPRPETSPVYPRYQLAATLSHPEHFSLLREGTDYHINVDSGMNRGGVSADQLEEVANRTVGADTLSCKGIYSHYATADDPGSDLVRQQQERFQSARTRFPSGIPTHMSNTAAVLHYDIDHFDMIRVGLGLAGYGPGKVQSSRLTPVLQWETQIDLVRPIRRGDGVSYGSTWKAPADGFLGVLPVGYADGIPRHLSNRLEVGVAGKRYSVAGSITMDLTLIYLGSQEFPPGTPVQLMGREKAWRANEWAEQAGTITHEILCRLTQRVQRTYETS